MYQHESRALRPLPPHLLASQMSLSVDAVRDFAIAQCEPVRGDVWVPLQAALARVLAAPVVAPVDVPAYANSAMDGFALRCADLPASGAARLRLAGEVLAGHLFAGDVPAGACVRIMTGGVVPAGADAVVPQEHARVGGGWVEVDAAPRPGQHIRGQGEDLPRGAEALAAGRRLTPADLGLIASLGFPEVCVRRRPRVAFFSTGDELCPLGVPLQPGMVYDSNRHALHGMLRRCGVEPIDLGVVADTPAALAQALQDACTQADAVITTGGVSVGVADHLRTVLQAQGVIRFCTVDMKPGRRLVIGRLGAGAAFFGLPGNPVAALVAFTQVVRPALERLAGAEPSAPVCIRARAAQALRKSPGRREFQRGIVTWDAQGVATVRPTGAQGSGMLHSMSQANCFIALPETCGPVAAGDLVCVELFGDLG